MDDELQTEFEFGSVVDETYEQSRGRADRRKSGSDAETTMLERLGAALYYYDTRQLNTLVERTTADPDPPRYAESVLPWVERLVAR